MRLCSAIIALTIALTLPMAASDCLRTSAYADADDARLAELNALDTRCRSALALLGEGRFGEALVGLRAAARYPELLAMPLDLPLAEASFGAGGPVESTLGMWERLTRPPLLVAARRSELVLRLPIGRAASLLAADPKRASASLLVQRATSDEEAPETVATVVRPERIGVLLPLTGRLAPLGRAMLDGMALAMGDGVELVVRDSGGGATAVARLVQELALEGVVAIVGPLDRSVALAAAEVAEGLSVPLIRLSVEDERARKRRWVFRAFLSRRSQYRSLVKRARKEGVKRFVIAAPESAYGRALASHFANVVVEQGANVAKTVSYAAGDTDYGAIAKQIARQRFGALFVADTADRAGLLLRYLAGQDVWSRGKRPRLKKRGDVRYVQVFGPSDWLTRPLPQTDLRYLAGVMLAAEWPGAEHSSVADFVSRATSQLGRAPGPFEAVGHDILALMQSIGARNRADVSRHLRELRSYPGLLGPLSFDELGEPERTPRLFRMTDGRYKGVAISP
ncbi:MAG: ABC-type branched-subunit amino acid transport system substrate-binding protein [Myxococcota bacterium]